MRKIISLIVVLLLIVSAFAGCGKKKEADPNLFVLKDLKLTAVNVSPYDGRYLEAGEEESVSGICAMKVTNDSDRTIQEAQLSFNNGEEEIYFHIDMLAAGQTVTVADLEKIPARTEPLIFVDGKVTYLEEGLEKGDCVTVTTGDNGAMTVSNATEEFLPLIRIFYRDTDGQGNQLGGMCRSALIDGLEPGGSVQPEAEGWNADCAVITVLVINE